MATKADKNKIRDLLVKHQVLLERVKSGEVRASYATLKKLNTATTQLLMAQGVDKLNELTKRKYLKLIDDLTNAELVILNSQVSQWNKNLTTLAGSESEFEQKLIKGMAKPGTEVAAVPGKKAMTAAKERPLSANGSHLDDFFVDWTKSQVKAMNSVVSKAYADGWTLQQAVTALRGTKAANYKDGVLGGKSLREIEAVVRTSLQHVSSSAREATWQENSDVVEKYKWVSTLDNNTTQQCRSLDGQVFDVSEGPMPPIHINCRSTVVPELGEEFAFLDEGATRSSEFGYVPADETYYDWLKRQDESYQDETLGVTRGQLFRDGGLNTTEFARLNIGRNFEPLTLDEMREKLPSAFEKAGL